MAEEFYSLVTDYGAEKQLKCLQEGTPFDVYQIRDYRKMDEDESILKKAEKFIKQYMPLFIPEK